MSSSLNRTDGIRGLPGSADVTDVESVNLPTDTRQPIRLGFWVLVVGFGGFMAWAALAPLDEGVATSATVAVETHRRVIQHLSGGVVSKVLAKEGQDVKAGDVLIELDSGMVRANYESVRQNYLAQRAAESRLLAEEAELPAVSFHRDLSSAAADPLVAQHMTAQVQLFNSRRAALTAELEGARASIAGLESQIAGIGSMLESRDRQAQLQAEHIQSIRGLAAAGYAPRNQVLQLEQSQADLRVTTAELQTTRLRAQQAIIEQRQRMTQRRQEYHKEAGAQLAEVRRALEGESTKLRALTEELGRIQIKSPVDGQVVGLAVSAVGGVVTPGQKLMELVPKGEALLLDARIPPNVIDRIKVGDATDVRFSAFAHTPQLVVDAHLVSLSTDVLVEQQGAMPMSFYLGRVQVSPEGLKMLGNRVMQPGMQAEVIIKTGERSLLTYLLSPLTKRIAASMKEE